MSLLAIRFVRWIAAISIVMTFAGVCLATYLEYRNDVQGIKDQVASVETFVPTLSTSLWRLDDPQIDIQLQGIVRLPAVERAAIVVGDEVAYQQNAGPGNTENRGEDTHFPLMFESAGVDLQLGTLVISADQSYATARVPIRFVEIAAIQGVRGVIIAAVFFWVFSHLVGSRLKQLSRDIGELNWENLQNQSIPTESETQDELAEVRNTLESMRVKIVEGMARENEAKAELEFRRLFDPVTGLPNRTLLTDRLNTLQKSGANPQLAVIGIELLRLSEIDYMLDGPSMNEALKEVAEALKNWSEPGGLLSRYSERRFVLVLGPVAGKTEADALVGEIADWFEKPIQFSGKQSLYFAAAFGIALSGDEGDEGDEPGSEPLLSRAVLALDDAVSRGDGSRVHWVERHNQGVASIYQELRTALNRRAFDLHCQPIFSLQDDQVACMECLIRWHSERLSAYGIQNSINVLEQSGMSGLLDRAVLDAAVALRGRLSDVYQGPMAINLTARSLSDSTYADYLQQQDKSVLDQLELELTETNVLHDVATAQRLAEQCTNQGVRLVLDDFGTGFSSIEYLSQFQFHSIKIDRSFLRTGLKNQQRLLQSMVSIAHGVGSRVVAEGIESDWQLEMVRELGIEYAQGFMLSRPLQESDLRDFLNSRKDPS